MEDLADIASRRQVIARLIPLLEAIRSVAEIAWRGAVRVSLPLNAYGERLVGILERTAGSLANAEPEALFRRWSGSGPVGLLLVTSERGLCGGFNHQLIKKALAEAKRLESDGETVRWLCLGARGQQLLAAAGAPVVYARSLPSLKVPDYLEVEQIAIELLDLAEQRTFTRLTLVQNVPFQRLSYRIAVRALLPPSLAMPGRSTGPIVVKPGGDTAELVNHLFTEHLLIELYRAVVDSVVSEQLARIFTMRLAVDNARTLLERLDRDQNVARRQAATNALLEIVSGYQATETAEQSGPGGNFQ